LFAQAVQCCNDGRAAQAEALCRQVLQQQPRHADAMHLLGLIAFRKGEPVAAAEWIGRSLRVEPENADACFNLALCCQASGRHSDAVQAYDLGLAIRPDVVDALINRGACLQHLGRYPEALASYERALELAPENLAALNNRGNALQLAGAFEEALAAYDQVLTLKPDHLEALTGRATAQYLLGRPDQSLASCDRALAIAPGYAPALVNRASALEQLNQFTDVLATLDRLLAVQPNHVAGLASRGVALRNLGRFQEALTSYERALALDPRDPEAHWGHAYLRLLLGDFDPGWAEYEWRLRRPAARATAREMERPRWTGQEDIAGKAVCVYAEQGIGDTVHFCRYAELLAARGAHVILEAQSSLTTLLQRLDGVAQIVGAGETLPEHDYQIPLLSLPLAFGTDLRTIPAALRYLTPDPQGCLLWERRLGPASAPRVGIVWAGSTTFSNDRNRSIGLSALLEPLLATGVGVVSLQKELRAGDRELLESHPGVLRVGEEVEDFADTAAVIANLDLVISVDTAVAHLAGALGKPVWILLPYAPDWRWLLDREDSPWYPTARLFRQPAVGDWASVIGRVGQELCRWRATSARA
jgi:tetratricopeptide (TPR) repeat protein